MPIYKSETHFENSGKKKKNFAATQLKASAPCYRRPRRMTQGFLTW